MRHSFWLSSSKSCALLLGDGDRVDGVLFRLKVRSPLNWLKLLCDRYMDGGPPGVNPFTIACVLVAVDTLVVDPIAENESVSLIVL